MLFVKSGKVKRPKNRRSGGSRRYWLVIEEIWGVKRKPVRRPQFIDPEYEKDGYF